ncbi:MAG: 30S ribosomal protein S6 [Proteobacteria bacterium]|nr:30S ribosomal protein S6 [Pseudomonadota bacterium]
MSYYESVFIARQDISAPQVETLADTFTEIISGGGGNVTKREYWGLRNLAYRIKKNRKGHYMLLNIDAPSDAILEMERNMRISEDILRYMTIRVDELEEGPSVMARSRSARDDHRPRRDGHHDRGPRRDERTAKDDQPAKEAQAPAAASDATAPSGEGQKAEAPPAKTGEDKAAAETAPETAKAETAKDGGGAETATEGDKT